MMIETEGLEIISKRPTLMEKVPYKEIGNQKMGLK
jgi:hypothetical protein